MADPVLFGAVRSYLPLVSWSISNVHCGQLVTFNVGRLRGSQSFCGSRLFSHGGGGSTLHRGQRALQSLSCPSAAQRPAGLTLRIPSCPTDAGIAGQQRASLGGRRALPCSARLSAPTPKSAAPTKPFTCWETMGWILVAGKNVVLNSHLQECQGVSCCFKGFLVSKTHPGCIAVVSVAVVGTHSCHWSRASQWCLFKEPP